MDTLTKPPETQQPQPPARPRRVTFPAVVAIAFLAVVAAFGYLIWQTVGDAVDAVPTVADIEEVFAPEPYQEIGGKRLPFSDVDEARAALAGAGAVAC